MKQKTAAKKKTARAARFRRPAKSSPVLAKALETILAPGFGKAPASPNIPDDIKHPNFGIDRGPSWIKPGRYRMRNGSAAIVVEPVTLKFGVQMRQTWQGWKGHLDGHPEGEGLVWGLDGKRSDATPEHEHDLLTRHKNQNYTCSKCGCTDARACRGGCSWVAPTRCSACFPVPA